MADIEAVTLGWEEERRIATDALDAIGPLLMSETEVGYGMFLTGAVAAQTSDWQPSQSNITKAYTHILRKSQLPRVAVTNPMELPEGLANHGLSVARREQVLIDQPGFLIVNLIGFANREKRLLRRTFPSGEILKELTVAAISQLVDRIETVD